jgi:hypothetical protein
VDSSEPLGPLDGREGALGVVAQKQSDEPAVRGRDGQTRQLLRLHPFDNIAEAGARADRAWPGRHRLFGCDVRSPADSAPTDPTEDDAPGVDDEAGSASQRSAFAGETKKFSAGQQPQQASFWLRIAPATTTADSGHHSEAPSFNGRRSGVIPEHSRTRASRLLRS